MSFQLVFSHRLGTCFEVILHMCDSYISLLAQMGLAKDTEAHGFVLLLPVQLNAYGPISHTFDGLTSPMFESNNYPKLVGDALG